MYTDLQVPRYLRSAALCVILLMGASPAVTLACEWACAPAKAQAHQHGEHHHGHGPAAATDMSAGPSLVTADTPCDHAAEAMAAVTTASVKVFAPGIEPSADRGFAVTSSVFQATLPPAAPSPPGIGRRPLSLRI